MEIGCIPLVIQYGDKIEVKPHKTGAWGFLSITNPSPVPDDDSGLDLTFRDVSTVRRMAQKLTTLADQMEAAQKARRRDAAPQAGKIRTPSDALSPCPHPARGGHHEWYTKVPNGGEFCRACGLEVPSTLPVKATTP